MTIKDKVLGDYEIQWSDTFTVVKNGVATNTKTGEKLPKQTNCGYFSTLEEALKKICKLLVEESSDVATITEVLERFETLWADIKNTIKI